MYKSMEAVDSQPFGPTTRTGIRGMQGAGLVPRPQTWDRVRQETPADQEYVGDMVLEIDQTGLDALVDWCTRNGHAGDIVGVKELIQPGLVPQPGEAQ